MKKNAMLKIAAILLVAVLLTTCAISATFAKYVTSTEEIADASARVAKWGITAEVTLKDTGVFQSSYVNNTTDNKVIVHGTNAVVAPGTKVEDAIEISVVFDGTPEVDYTITSDFALINDGGEWKAGSAEYFPITLVLDVNNTKTEVNAAGTMSFAAAKAEFDQKLNDAFKDATDDVTVKIGWYWAPEVNNTNDTLLGNASNAPEIGFEGNITLEQVIDANDGYAQ